MEKNEEQVIQSLIMEDFRKGAQFGALLELLVAKGIFTMDEYDNKYKSVMSRVVELGGKYVAELEKK